MVLKKSSMNMFHVKRMTQCAVIFLLFGFFSVRAQSVIAEQAEIASKNSRTFSFMLHTIRPEVVLEFKARIHNETIAGVRHVMTVILNGKKLDMAYLLSREATFTLPRRESTPSIKNDMHMLLYTPDFSPLLQNNKYAPENIKDPFLFRFNITGLAQKGENILTISHSADISNPVLIEGVKVYDDADAEPTETMLRMRKFTNYGIISPSARPRGVVATQDAKGKNIIIAWLMTHTKNNMLSIDPQTGASSEVSIIDGLNGQPFGFIFTENRYFNTVGRNGHFIRYDVHNPSNTYIHKIGGDAQGFVMRPAMDKKGILYFALYPNCTLVSFNPVSKEFINYGSLNTEAWNQYPRTTIFGEDNWVYIGIGDFLEQIIAFNPETREIVKVVQTTERKKGYGTVTAGKDGFVYGTVTGSGTWYQFSKGKFKIIPDQPDVEWKTLPIGRDSAVLADFPDGKKIAEINISSGNARIFDPKTGETNTIRFTYSAESGPRIYSMLSAPDGYIYGSTGQPIKFFRFDPKTSEITHTGYAEAQGHINVMTWLDGKLYGGIYGDGIFFSVDLTKAWETINWNVMSETHENPKVHHRSPQNVYRPTALVTASDSKTVIMSGLPPYSTTGSGLMFFDICNNKIYETDKQMIPHNSTRCMVVLPGGILAGGTTVIPGTGAKPASTQSFLYLMDIATRKILYTGEPYKNAYDVRDMLYNPDTGLIYGLLSTGDNNLKEPDNKQVFFVFDPGKKKFIHTEILTGYGLIAGASQGPRSLTFGPGKLIYALFSTAIVQINPRDFTHETFAELPEEPWAGLLFHKGVFYYGVYDTFWSYTP